MTENPFATPSPDPQPGDLEPRVRPRLLLLPFLSIITLLFSGVMAATIVATTQHPDVQAAFAAPGFGPEIVVLVELVPYALGILAGLAMWSGAPWGWAITTFYYGVWIVLRCGKLFTIALAADLIVAAGRRPESPVFLQLLSISLCGALLAYFFAPKVREYYRAESVAWWKALLLIAVLSLAFNAILIGTVMAIR